MFEPRAVATAAALAAWLYLLFGHGRYWLADSRLEDPSPEPENWPGVAVLVPARNEAVCLPDTLPTLLEQDYPGRYRVFLVDDESEDDTWTAAEALARTHPRGHRLEVLGAPERPPGWAGKLWALESGRRALDATGFCADWVLLTDADIRHGPRTVRRLVTHGLAQHRDLVSLMVRLRSDAWSERLLIPAFVYFFQQLFPFPRTNDPHRRTAAAAGGCLLVRRDALFRVGAFASIRGEIIDDCALARLIKRHGSLWLGLTDTSRSVRGYGGWRGVWAMVTRTAYTQLSYSPLALAGATAAMLWLYALPPVAACAGLWRGDAWTASLGAAAWLLAALSWVPTLARYDRHPLWGLALPAAAAVYTAMTLDSARRHYGRRGAMWKGRSDAGKLGPHGEPLRDAR